MPSTSKRPYHHGDLRAALIRTAWELIEEDGIEGFSMAEAARRTGVSPRAPYRHFADREALLAATAAEASVALEQRLEETVAAHAGDPIEQLAAGAAAYVRYAEDHPAGFDVMYRSGLDKTDDEDLQTAWRRITDILLPPALSITPDLATGTSLLEGLWCLMHGYATLLRDGFFRDRTSDHPRHPASRAAAAARALARSYATG